MIMQRTPPKKIQQVVVTHSDSTRNSEPDNVLSNNRIYLNQNLSQHNVQDPTGEKPFNTPLANGMETYYVDPYMHQQNSYLQPLQLIQSQQPMGTIRQTQQTFATQRPLLMTQYPVNQIHHQQNAPHYQTLLTPQLPAPQFITQGLPLPHPHTEWQTVPYKKRVRSPEQLKARKQSKITNYWLSAPPETSNRFEGLPEERETNTTDTINEGAAGGVTEGAVFERKPPPITVYGAENASLLQESIEKIASSEYSLKTVGHQNIKIQLNKGEHFKPVIEFLDSKNTQYHTYKPKEEKSFRIVMKGLHHSIKPDVVITALKNLGHEATNVWNIKHRLTKQPLPMHYVDLKTSDNNKSIYDVKSLNRNVVQFEPPRVKRIIPQCTRCQDYGHTKNFCRRLDRCVKCAGNHNTANCRRKERDNQVKCANCEGAHPANYRGCIIHKQIQQRLYPKLREKRLAEPKGHEMNQQPYPTESTYTTNNYNREFPTLPPTQYGITFPQPANNNPLQENVNWQLNQTTNQNQTSHQTTSDIGELKNMLKELIEQNKENARNMSSMLNLLTTLVNKINNDRTP